MGVTMLVQSASVMKQLEDRGVGCVVDLPGICVAPTSGDLPYLFPNSLRPLLREESQFVSFENALLLASI